MSEALRFSWSLNSAEAEGPCMDDSTWKNYTEGLGGFFQRWSSSILALLVCDSSQDNTLQPSSYEVICIYNSGWCLCALKPSENSKSVCLCFSICRGNNIHPSQTVNGLICWIPYGILSMQRTIKMQNMTMILFLPCSFSHQRTMFQPQVVKLIPHIFIHNLARQ